MRLPSLTLLLLALAGCAGSRPPTASPSVPVYADTTLLRVGAEALVDAFAAEVARARGGALAEAPRVEVRNTPFLIFFDGDANQIVVPWWETQPAEMRGVFRTFAGGGDADAEHLFRAFFNRFLVAHEAAHWFQARADRSERTLYDNENAANRLAAAFFRTQPGGERFLAALERLAEDAAASVPDPTPPGEDPVAYFGANYRALGPEPLKYGYYQFRFMADALRDRAQLDFAQMVTAVVPAAAESPTLVLHSGVVFTADPARPRAEALAVAGDRIFAVGTNAEIQALTGLDTEVIDLGGRLVVPGLNDAHVHVGPWPEMRGLGLSGRSEPAWSLVLDSLRAAVAATPPGTWIQGSLGGAALDDPAADRFALDAVAPDHPVMLTGWTGHGMVLNTAALRTLGFSLVEPDRPGGAFGRVAGTDTLDGRLWEYPQLDVVRRISDPLPRADAVAAYRDFAGQMVRWGVTSIQQMENDRPLEETLAALAEADVALRWGVFAWPMPVRSVDEPRPAVARPPGLPDRVRVLGTKWMLDGTPVERGAALRQPYADRPGWSGRVNFTDDELQTILRSALERDEQTALHIVGDATLARVLDAMAALGPASAWRAKRVRIEHGEGLMPDLLARTVEFGLVLVQNPLHFSIPDVMAARYGGERLGAVQLLRSAAEAGVPVALGADAGGSGGNPWLNLMMATLHPVNPSEALSREAALVAYTRGSAFAEGQEAEKGTLAPGMLADLAVLSQNVLDVPPDALPATESVLTLVGGRVVHRSLD